MGMRRGQSKQRLLKHYNIPARPKEAKEGHLQDHCIPTAWIIHELLHCVDEQSQRQHSKNNQDEQRLLHAALGNCDLAEEGLDQSTSDKLARVVALVLNRVFVRSNAFGQVHDLDASAFTSINAFVNRRLEALVALLFPSAADPAVCSALNALANGATAFTCKAYVRASIAVPLISRFAQALLRCALEAGQSGIYWELHEELLEAACGCLRNAFKSLEDALRITANSPNGLRDINRLDLVKGFQEISALFGRLYDQALMPSTGCLHVSAVLVAALQLECSPIITEASDKWVSPTLLLLLDPDKNRWARDLGSRLRAFEAGTGGDSAVIPTNNMGSPSSEFTGMLQLLKAVLQATELFMGKHADLSTRVEKLLLMRVPPECEGSPASLLGSLIRTLCSGAAISIAHAYKIAYILCICVARHADWRLSAELFDRHCLFGVVSGVLKVALRQREAAMAQRMLQTVNPPDQAQPLGSSHVHTLSSAAFRVRTVGSLLDTVRPLLFGKAGEGPEAVAAGQHPPEPEEADVARQRAEAYLENVRAGMVADKAPSVAAVASAIVHQEEALCASGTDRAPLAVPEELARLAELLDDFMPASTGCGKPIDYNRRDNVCRGAATDNGLVPPDLAEDSFLEAQRTPPDSPRLATHPTAPHGNAATVSAGPAEAAGNPKNGIPGKAQSGSLQAAESLNAQLRRKLAELEELKRLKAEQQRSTAGSTAAAPSSNGPIAYSSTGRAAPIVTAELGRDNGPAKLPRRAEAVGSLSSTKVGLCAAATAASPSSDSLGGERSAGQVRDFAAKDKMQRPSHSKAGTDNAEPLQHPFFCSACPGSGRQATEKEQLQCGAGRGAQPCSLQGVAKEGVLRPGDPADAHHPSGNPQSLHSPVGASGKTQAQKEKSHSSQEAGADATEQRTITQEAAATRAVRGSATPAAAGSDDTTDKRLDGAKPVFDQETKTDEASAAPRGAVHIPVEAVGEQQQLKAVRRQQREKFASFHGRAGMDVDSPADPPAAATWQQVVPPAVPPLGQRQDEEMHNADEDVTMEDAHIIDGDVLMETCAKAISPPSPSYAAVTAGAHSAAAQNSTIAAFQTVPLVALHRSGGNHIYGPPMRDCRQAGSSGAGGSAQQSTVEQKNSVSVKRGPPPGMDWAAFHWQQQAAGPLAFGQREMRQPSYSQMAAQRPAGNMGGKIGGGRVGGCGLEEIGKVDYRRK